MRDSPTSFCPVPIEQQPANEYEQLKDAWLFRWATLDFPDYLKKFLWLGFWSWLLVAPVAAASFPPQKHPALFGVASSAGAAAIALLVTIRILLGWYYVRDRLQSERIFYEESGWYDGQTWQKPPEILTRDRLIVSYQIDPLLARLQKTAAFLAGWVVLGIAIGSWLR